MTHPALPRPHGLCRNCRSLVRLPAAAWSAGGRHRNPFWADFCRTFGREFRIREFCPRTVSDVSTRPAAFACHFALFRLGAPPFDGLGNRSKAGFQSIAGICGAARRPFPRFGRFESSPARRTPATASGPAGSSALGPPMQWCGWWRKDRRKNRLAGNSQYRKLTYGLHG